eukprot:9481850-Pyramimonas_sp.AAC.2
MHAHEDRTLGFTPQGGRACTSLERLILCPLVHWPILTVSVPPVLPRKARVDTSASRLQVSRSPDIQYTLGSAQGCENARTCTRTLATDDVAGSPPSPIRRG